MRPAIRPTGKPSALACALACAAGAAFAQNVPAPDHPAGGQIEHEGTAPAAGAIIDETRPGALPAPASAASTPRASAPDAAASAQRPSPGSPDRPAEGRP